MKLAPLETEVIDLFVQIARMAAIPKSAAEIYGLLFVSSTPLTLDEITTRLDLSKGSGSQGLKLLRTLGAVRTIYVAGKRNDHFEAEIELRNLVRGLLKDKLHPHLINGSDRINRIEAMLNNLPAAERTHISPRLDKLKNWQERGAQFLPLVEQLLT